MTSGGSSMNGGSDFTAGQRTLGGHGTSSSGHYYTLPVIHGILYLVSQHPPAESVASPGQFVTVPLAMGSQHGASSSGMSTWTVSSNQ